jgi:hypothetical protein
MCYTERLQRGGGSHRDVFVRNNWVDPDWKLHLRVSSDGQRDNGGDSDISGITQRDGAISAGDRESPDYFDSFD